MVKRIKWFLGDVHRTIVSLLMKKKISKLKMGDIVVFKGKTEMLFQGVNYWSFKEGFTPQYSVLLIDKDEDPVSFFETPITNVKFK